MVIPLCNITKVITSVTAENNFIIPAHSIMINKDQEISEGLETSRVSPSYEPNTMDCHRNALTYYDEGRIKYYKPDQTKTIILVTPDKIGFVTTEDKFICYAQVIITNRDQGRKLGPDISIIFTDHDSNIIGFHRNALFPDEGGNKVSNPDLDTASKHNLDITQCANYLFNDPFNIDLDTPSSNFSCKDYGTPTTPPKDRKES